jgi:hypothetical protein
MCEQNKSDVDKMKDFDMGYVAGLAYALDILDGPLPFPNDEAIYRLKAVFDARVKKMTEDSK